MLPLVEIPDIVQHYAPFFASVFSPQAFHQFQRYLSGLIVSENKTVVASTLSKIDPFMLTKIDPLTARVLAAL